MTRSEEYWPDRRRGRTGPVLVLVIVLVLGGLAGVALARRGGLDLPVPGLGAECTVATDDGEIDLDRDQARRATTAVALQARGLTAPDVSDIDDAVLERLSSGPEQDAGPSLRCRGTGEPDVAAQDLTASGLTPRADRVRLAMAEVFGEQSLGGFAPGGVQRAEESTHNDGRAVDVFYRPVNEDNRREGWQLAHWLVAHAVDLDIQYVIFDDQYWYSGGRRGQWRDYQAPAPADEILRHLDHVHVDVWRGD